MAAKPAVTPPSTVPRQKPDTRTGEIPRIEINAPRAGEPPQPPLSTADEAPMPSLAAEEGDREKFCEDNMLASQP